MLKQGAGAFYPPTALYRGFAVYKIIQTREADEKQFSELREGYIKQVEAKKRLAAYDEWFAGLKKEADPSKVWIVR